MLKVNIAITYNKNASSKTVLSLRDAINEEVNAIDCDYRKILPPREGLDEIFKNEVKREAIFQEAKRNAKLFLQNTESAIDGLILSGNPAMVDPRLFGKPLPIDSNEETDLPRAIAEMALTQVALDMGMPIFGICGGLQILNVSLDGSIKYLTKFDLKKEGHDKYSVINLDPNSILSKTIKVKSGQFFASHYQAIDEVGGKKRINEKENYLAIVGRSEDISKNIAVVESQFGSIVVGIQDHPEVATNGYASSDLPKNISKDIYKATGEVFEINKRIFNLMIDAAITFKHKKELNNEIQNGGPKPSKQAIYKEYLKKIKKPSREKCTQHSC